MKLFQLGATGWGNVTRFFPHTLETSLYLCWAEFLSLKKIESLWKACENVAAWLQSPNSFFSAFQFSSNHGCWPWTFCGSWEECGPKKSRSKKNKKAAPADTVTSYTLATHSPALFFNFPCCHHQKERKRWRKNADDCATLEKMKTKPENNNLFLSLQNLPLGKTYIWRRLGVLWGWMWGLQKAKTNVK